MNDYIYNSNAIVALYYVKYSIEMLDFNWKLKMKKHF